MTYTDKESGVNDAGKEEGEKSLDQTFYEFININMKRKILIEVAFAPHRSY